MITKSPQVYRVQGAWWVRWIQDEKQRSEKFLDRAEAAKFLQFLLRERGTDAAARVA